jgi:hypothetical protein
MKCDPSSADEYNPKNNFARLQIVETKSDTGKGNEDHHAALALIGKRNFNNLPTQGLIQDSLPEQREKDFITMAADERIPEAARLNYTALDARGVIQDPLTEQYEPEIHSATKNPTKVCVLTPPGLSQVPPIYLMRADKDVTKAYALTSTKEISLDGHGPGWGCIQFAVVYHRMAQKNCNQDLIF